MMTKINIKHITNLNNDCLRGLAFYQQELDILRGRLEEIAADNTGRIVAEKVEHFQNQFMIHSYYIDELKHLIHANDKAIESELVKTSVFVNEEIADKHDQLVDKYHTEEKIFNELRHEFNRFAAEWM
ncbi:MAG: hypothetical protein ACXVAY_07545 [Mucilaginibacter sp.]